MKQGADGLGDRGGDVVRVRGHAGDEVAGGHPVVFDERDPVQLAVERKPEISADLLGVMLHPPVENQVEYSFELNAHNKTLLEQIKNAKRRSEAMRRYPGSFAETLVALQKERKLSNKQLADRSLVGEKTIQRLRNDEEYPTSVQTVLALCVGLKLPLPEAEMFLGKTDFKLNSMKGEGYVYQCVLGACAENSIYEINEMLKENGITPLGSDPSLQ